MTTRSELTGSWAVRTRLEAWFSDTPGRLLLQAEREQVGRVLPQLFGYHILQLGALGAQDLLGSASISHRVVLSIDPEGGCSGSDRLICKPEALPLAANSIDGVVLPHVLEFAPAPQQVLREIERVLIGEGQVVILGFNPWSLWGLWRLALAWRKQVPWSGQFFGLMRVKEWLRSLGFEIVLSRCFFFRPPLQSPSMMSRLTCLERLGDHGWPYGGGTYIVVGKKRVVILTPLKMDWQERRFAGGAVKPAP
jgi:SAM-dependent methyltransferase